MADEDQDDSQKTEEPSQRRLEEAFKKGNVANSREVTSFLMLLIFTITIIWLSPFLMQKAAMNMKPFLEAPHLIRLDSQSILVLAKDVLGDIAAIMMIPISIIIIVIVISSLMQHGLVISWDPVTPKLEKISIIKGLGRMFSLKSVVEFVKGLIKISLVGIVGFFAVYPELSNIESLTGIGLIATLKFLAILAARLMIGVSIVMGIIAVLDFLYQKFEHTKSLRMSKRDLKDEFKQTEGNPEVKAKLREIRNQRANNRMMQSVPEADVVITNPTHYAVALKYEEAKNEAPIVVAKGQDLIALKIREIAKENDVPIVENPPLARALFSSVEVEQEIPLEHYHAVAEVIRYVYKLKGKKAA